MCVHSFVWCVCTNKKHINTLRLIDVAFITPYEIV